MDSSKSIGEGIAATFVIGWGVIVIAAMIGYVMNIINLFSIESPIEAIEILQIVGALIIPLGAIMGWIV